MTIKELEQRTGLPRTSIRFYEQEGFLHPERRENNYRDYSQEDVCTLEKIKLLRQLSLDLDTIRRLQKGEISLSQALTGQAQALEGDREDLERYVQVCEAICRTGTTYEDLEPELWLSALAEQTLPMSRRVDPAKQDSIAAAPYPWRRFFARTLDLSLAGVVWLVLQYLVFHWYWPDQTLYGLPNVVISAWGGWLILFLVEPFLLCTWGSTPGKWLLRLQVRREDGRKLPWDDAVERMAKIFLWGVGLEIPFYDFMRMEGCYTQCKHDQVMRWDRGLRYTARPVGKGRAAGMAVCLCLSGLAGSAVMDASYRLPNPSGPLTVEQVVENYNFLERRTNGTQMLEDHPRAALNRDGSWYISPAAAVDDQTWVEYSEGEKGEWGPVEFFTDLQGYVTGFTVVWSPEGSAYHEELELNAPMTEYLPNLFLALSPAGERWSPPWTYVWHDRWVQARLVGVFDLYSADLMQAGERAETNCLPGLNIRMEVLRSQGYRSSSLTGINLVPLVPGEGELSLRFTVSCSG